MNRRSAFFTVGLLLLQAPARAEPISVTSVTLQQCFLWAKAQSEELKIRQERVQQAKDSGRAALGEALPHLEWEFSDIWQDPKGVDELSRQGFGGFVAKNQKQSDILVRQPLFAGRREFSASAGFKQESLREALLHERATSELFEQMADAFYTVIALETDRQNLQMTLKLAGDRLKELQQFLGLGKSRHSDIYTAQARLSAEDASLSQIEGRIASAREALSFVTGQDLSSPPLVDEIPSPPVVISLDEALAQARNRSDLRAQRAEIAAARFRTRYERGAFWPTADVSGRYYTQRDIYLSAIDWDVLLALHVPIYQGGTVAAHVREAVSMEREAEWTLSEMERRILSAVRQTHGELLAALRETTSLEAAADAATKSYEALRKEYRLGLTTNIEVLEALDLLQTQTSARDTARLRAKQFYLRLNVLTEKVQ